MNEGIVEERHERIKFHVKNLEEITEKTEVQQEIIDNNNNLHKVMLEIKKKGDLRDLMRKNSSEYNVKYFEFKGRLDSLIGQEQEALQSQ